MSNKQKNPTKGEMLETLKEVQIFLGDCLFTRGKFCKTEFPESMQEKMWELYYDIDCITDPDSILNKPSVKI